MRRAVVARDSGRIVAFPAVRPRLAGERSSLHAFVAVMPVAAHPNPAVLVAIAADVLPHGTHHIASVRNG